MMKVVLLACFQEGFNYILLMTPLSPSVRTACLEGTA